MIDKLRQIIEENFQNEQLSVEDLAGMMNMSRSQLHRNLKQATGKSANQFIREYRLERAMELLKRGELNVSEVAFQVGFASASYFTTCFAEHFGYPPGEVKNKSFESTTENVKSADPALKRLVNKKKSLFVSAGLSAIVLLLFFLVYHQFGQRVMKSNESMIEKSIAVLPFKNLNDDKRNEYFSEGVAEAINRNLSQVQDLEIISITSTNRYRKSQKSVQEIAGELHVSYLLEGSIQRYDNTVRMEVRLVNAGSERLVWAKNYDRELKDIFTTQTEIAEQVALALKSTLSDQEKKLLRQDQTKSVEAYDLYMKGIYEYRTYTRTGIHNAIGYLKGAIELDPDYALAYLGLAGSYILQASIFGAELHSLDAMALARPLLDTALSLDPELSEAHLWSGFCLLFNDWDFEGAEREYRKAIVDNNPDALYVYADLLNFTRRHNEALTLCEKMLDLDPYYPNNLVILSLFFLGRLDEAVTIAESRVRLFSNYSTLDNYGFLLLNTGQYAKAIDVFNDVMEIENVRYPRMLAWSGVAWAKLDRKEKSLAIIDELKEKRKDTDVGSLAFFIAVVYSALDDKQSALSWLEESVRKHEMEVPWLLTEPQFYPFHSDPVFQQLVTEVGFPG